VSVTIQVSRWTAQVAHQRQIGSLTCLRDILADYSFEKFPVVSLDVVGCGVRPARHDAEQRSRFVYIKCSALLGESKRFEV